MYVAVVALELAQQHVADIIGRRRQTVAHALMVIEDKRDDRAFDEAVELIGRNILVGPNGTRYQEQLLAAVRTLDADPKTRQAVVVTVETYVVGQITFALDEQGSAETEHRSPTRSRQAVRQYQRDLMATGEFPQLSSVGPPQPSSAADRERYFNLGLDWLLAGIGAGLEPDAGPHPAG